MPKPSIQTRLGAQLGRPGPTCHMAVEAMEAVDLLEEILEKGTSHKRVSCVGHGPCLIWRYPFTFRRNGGDGFVPGLCEKNQYFSGSSFSVYLRLRYWAKRTRPPY